RILSGMGEEGGEPLYAQARGLRMGRLPQVSPSGPFITFLGVSLETEHTRMGKASAHQAGSKIAVMPRDFHAAAA
ncbi:MAG: hypothetical protein LGR52_00055, partial [Candidatus Thiosymbion ectosymbiont of Robbea hypermnestra]|nr:hypothetical protein [Candidatus Thiosymbion ectosymbiont of Robbea hypermnestra]